MAAAICLDLEYLGGLVAPRELSLVDANVGVTSCSVVYPVILTVRVVDARHHGLALLEPRTISALGLAQIIKIVDERPFADEEAVISYLIFIILKIYLSDLYVHAAIVFSVFIIHFQIL